MDTLNIGQLEQIEQRLSLTAIEKFGLDLSGLVLDMTNLATFIDSANGRAAIAQRGKAKQKRHDLRLVGLALVVTTDGAVPVVSHPYPGNRHDSTQFTGLLDQIVLRWTALGGDPAELTVTYDSGQNSTDNQPRPHRNLRARVCHLAAALRPPRAARHPRRHLRAGRPGPLRGGERP
jgi:transposase